MLSLTIQCPDNKTASQGIIIPLDGRIIISPGTNNTGSMLYFASELIKFDFCILISLQLEDSTRSCSATLC